jgi:hypothetical protein
MSAKVEPWVDVLIVRLELVWGRVGSIGVEVTNNSTPEWYRTHIYLILQTKNSCSKENKALIISWQKLTFFAFALVVRRLKIVTLRENREPINYKPHQQIEI